MNETQLTEKGGGVTEKTQKGVVTETMLIQTQYYTSELQLQSLQLQKEIITLEYDCEQKNFFRTLFTSIILSILITITIEKLTTFRYLFFQSLESTIEILYDLCTHNSFFSTFSLCTKIVPSMVLQIESVHHISYSVTIGLFFLSFSTCFVFFFTFFRLMESDIAFLGFSFKKRK